MSSTDCVESRKNFKYPMLVTIRMYGRETPPPHQTAHCCNQAAHFFVLIPKNHNMWSTEINTTPGELRLKNFSLVLSNAWVQA